MPRQRPPRSPPARCPASASSQAAAPRCKAPAARLQLAPPCASRSRGTPPAACPAWPAPPHPVGQPAALTGSWLLLRPGCAGRGSLPWRASCCGWGWHLRLWQRGVRRWVSITLVCDDGAGTGGGRWGDGRDIHWLAAGCGCIWCGMCQGMQLSPKGSVGIRLMPCRHERAATCATGG